MVVVYECVHVFMMCERARPRVHLVCLCLYISCYLDLLQNVCVVVNVSPCVRVHACVHLVCFVCACVLCVLVRACVEVSEFSRVRVCIGVVCFGAHHDSSSHVKTVCGCLISIVMRCLMASDSSCEGTDHIFESSC